MGILQTPHTGVERRACAGERSGDDSAFPTRGSDFLRVFTVDLWRSLNPADEAAANIVTLQLKFIRESTRGTPFVLPAAGLFVAFAFSDWIAWTTLAGWWTVLAALCAANERIGQVLDKAVSIDVAQVRLRAALYTAMSFGATLAWASIALFFWIPGDVTNHMLIILILACSLSGASALMATHPALAVATCAPYVVLMIVRPLLEGTTFDIALAGLCASFSILMVGQTRSIYLSTSKLLRLQDERGELIDNLRAAKEESDHALVRAEAANRAKSKFLANMSHELRTPLNAVLGFSEMIRALAFKKTPEKCIEYADFIHDSGQHLLSLINDILDLARIDAGQITLHESAIDLAELIDDGLQFVAPEADAKNVALARSLPKPMPLLYGDPNAVRQILVNLLTNAIKYTPPDGRAEAFAKVTEDGEIELGVSDTGIGIPPENLGRVFQGFGQTRHDVSSPDKGVGLGLPIVKGLAEAHGGRVVLHSMHGHGTRIAAVFPRSRVIRREQADPEKVAS